MKCYDYQVTHALESASHPSLLCRDALGSAKPRVNRNAVRGAGDQNASACDDSISEEKQLCFPKFLACYQRLAAWFALRVPSAVTRLTVYRWLRVPVQVARPARLAGIMCELTTFELVFLACF